jgi:hypothetical protein
MQIAYSEGEHAFTGDGCTRWRLLVTKYIVSQHQALMHIHLQAVNSDHSRSQLSCKGALHAWLVACKHSVDDVKLVLGFLQTSCSAMS